MEMNVLNSDTIRKWKDMRISTEQQSHYIRTTWMLSAESTLKLLDTTCIRFFSEEEAQELAKIARKRKPEPDIRGITINEKFCRRFERCGFPSLALLCTSDNDIANRVMSTINWLFESRQEPVLSASIVKTSIALESLLISNESEPLAKSLSERAAFILSSDPDIRQKISKIVKIFYDTRSGVVHGSQKKAKSLLQALLRAWIA